MKGGLHYSPLPTFSSFLSSSSSLDVRDEEEEEKKVSSKNKIDFVMKNSEHPLFLFFSLIIAQSQVSHGEQ